MRPVPRVVAVVVVDRVAVVGVVVVVVVVVVGGGSVCDVDVVCWCAAFVGGCGCPGWWYAACRVGCVSGGVVGLFVRRFCCWFRMRSLSCCHRFSVCLRRLCNAGELFVLCA